MIRDDNLNTEDSLWAAFSAPEDASEFYRSWLAILCIEVERVNGALLLLGKSNTFTPSAIWPSVGQDMTHLVATAKRALSQREGVVAAADGLSQHSAQQAAQVAYPIVLSGDLLGAVVLDLAQRPDDALGRALRKMHWAIGWLNDVFRQRQIEAQEGRTGRLAVAMDVVATALHEGRFGACAIAVANDVAKRLHCARVSVGIERGGHVEVKAISNIATFDAKADFVRLIAEAMDEVLDYGTAVVMPNPYPDALPAAAHADLARERGGVAVCSVPLVAEGRNVGVMTLERGAEQPFEAETLGLVETLGLLVGPVLELKRDADRGAISRLRDSSADTLRAVFGPRHPGAKMIAALAAVVFLFLALVNGEHRVAAKTVAEGAVQRVMVAPFEGFIAEGLARAGDRVAKGQALCRLDDRDLKLEWHR